MCAFSPEIEYQESESQVQPRYIAVFIDSKYFNRQLALYGISEIPAFTADCYPQRADLVNLLKEFFNEYDD